MIKEEEAEEKPKRGRGRPPKAGKKEDVVKKEDPGAFESKHVVKKEALLVKKELVVKKSEKITPPLKLNKSLMQEVLQERKKNSKFLSRELQGKPVKGDDILALDKQRLIMLAKGENSSRAAAASSSAVEKPRDFGPRHPSAGLASFVVAKMPTAELVELAAKHAAEENLPPPPLFVGMGNNRHKNAKGNYPKKRQKSASDEEEEGSPQRPKKRQKTGPTEKVRWIYKKTFTWSSYSPALLLGYAAGLGTVSGSCCAGDHDCCGITLVVSAAAPCSFAMCSLLDLCATTGPVCRVSSVFKE